MQLTYRGIQYNAAPAATTTTTTTTSGLTATYRGLSYSIPQSNTVATMPTKPLKYRGITIGTPEPDWHPAFRPASA